VSLSRASLRHRRHTSRRGSSAGVSPRWPRNPRSHGPSGCGLDKDSPTGQPRKNESGPVQRRSPGPVKPERGRQPSGKLGLLRRPRDPGRAEDSEAQASCPQQPRIWRSSREHPGVSSSMPQARMIPSRNAESSGSESAQAPFTALLPLSPMRSSAAFFQFGAQAEHRPCIRAPLDPLRSGSDERAHGPPTLQDRHQ